MRFADPPESVALTSMNEEEAEALTVAGLIVTQDIAGIICETIWWSCYLVFFIFALRIQLRKKLRTPNSILMFGTTLFLFATSTTLWALNATVLLRRSNGFFLNNPSWSIVDKLNLTNLSVYPFGVPMESLFLANLLVGDCVVMARAAVLWRDRRFVLVFPLLFFFASLGFTILAIVCLVEEGWGSGSSKILGSRACSWSEPIAWATSLCTNLISTTLIAIQAWKYRRFLRENLGKQSTKTTGEKALILLVESGFIYCLFWMSQVVLFLEAITRQSSALYLYTVLSTLGDQISGLYPTVIIVLVHFQKTMAQATKSTMEGGTTRLPHNITTLQFASSGEASFPHPGHLPGETEVKDTKPQMTSISAAPV